MKTYKLISVLFCISMTKACFSQNLVSSQSWTVGSGSVGIFSQNGVSTQNVRELGIGPYNTQTILWKAVADAANESDGGWNTDNFAIDNTKLYRFAIWIKKTNSVDGYSYFGCKGNDILDLTGSVNANPYFWYGDLPTLDKWYFLVGYVHGSGDPSLTSYGGIYDGVTGAKVVSIQDFKFSDTATTAAHRTYLYYDTNISDRQYFFGPEVFRVDQPLAETIFPSMVSGNSFFGSNVGIGTTTPGSYKLAVEGKIGAREVNVNTTAWSDYVLSDNYKLRSLDDVYSFIKEYQHLPDVPSESEVLKNGQNLGEMNSILLKKIEELTLYVIDLKKENEEMRLRINRIEGMNK